MVTQKMRFKNIYKRKIQDRRGVHKADDKEGPVIVLAADDKYAMPLTVTVCSVIKNLKKYKNIQLFVMDGEITEVNKELMRKSLDSEKVSIHWVKIPDEIIDELKVLQQHGHYNFSVYLRLLIPKLLPPDIEKVIYLDCDMIVEDDISELWDVDIKNHVVLAVQDSYIPYLSDRSQVIDWRKLRATKESKYFSTGVLVINNKEWLKEDIYRKTVQFLQENPRPLGWPDQDALNAVLVEKWGELDWKWNYIVVRDEYDERLAKKASIIHIASHDKPWHYGFDKPTKKIFFKYLDMTAWSGWRPKGTLKQEVKRKIKYIVKLSEPLREKLGLTGGYIRKQQSRSAKKSIAIRKKFDRDEPISNRNELPSLLITLGLNGEGAEIGVHRAYFSKVILANSYLSKLYSIDPWKKLNSLAIDIFF